MKPALAILTNSPHIETILFLHEVGLADYFDTYLVCDKKNEYKTISFFTTEIILKDEKCKRAGYVNSMYIEGRTHIQKEVVALDKALFYFCEMEEKPEYLWLIEEDVLITSVNAIIALDKKCSTNDLCSPSHKRKIDDCPDWHWPYISKQIGNIIPKPWHYSMSCAIRVSSKMLELIQAHAHQHKTLFFNEVMFNTLANQNNLSVFTPPELKSIVWQGEFSLDDIMLLPGNLFHPKKQIYQHAVIRHCLKIIKGKGYVPVNKLPMFLRENLNETEE